MEETGHNTGTGSMGEGEDATGGMNTNRTLMVFREGRRFV
jgi:hypothetical protein